MKIAFCYQGEFRQVPYRQLFDLQLLTVAGIKNQSNLIAHLGH